MHDPFDKEIYDFLARKMFTGDLKKMKEVLLFWTDLIAGEFEQGVATGGLDSEDKAHIQDTIEWWFYHTLLDLIGEMQDAETDEDKAAVKIKRVVQARIRGIIKDLLFKRRGNQGSRRPTRKGEKKEKDPASPDGSDHNWNSRASLFTSHLAPEVQEAVFADPYSDAETQLLYLETLWEEEAETETVPYAPIKQQNGGKSLDPAKEDVAVFLAKATYLEMMRVRLANSKRTGSEV